MRVLALLLLAAALVSFAHGVALSTNSYIALKALVTSTNGAGWTVPWDVSTFNTTFCSGNGGTATCDALGNVRTIKLSKNNLSGPLPTEIGLLATLNSLYLDNNSLTGSIPSELGKLTKMATLLLNSNQLSGSVPTQLGNLVTLGGIFFYDNQLSGSFPSEVALLPNVVQSHNYDNQFTDLPPSFGAKTQSIRFENNLLTGTIHTTLFTPSLTNFRLSSNALSGEIPTEIGLATNLQIFYVWENTLSGSIPTQLGNIGIQRFWAYYNGLTGQIPTQLAASKTLIDLRLMSNQLTGSLPAAFGSSSLQYLWVSNNQLTGTIPSNLLASSTITSLRINLNYFSGQLPKEIVFSAALQNFIASNTCISPITDYSRIVNSDYYSFTPNPGCTASLIGQPPPYLTSAPATTVLIYQFPTGLGSLSDSSPSNNALTKITSAITLISTNIGQAYNPLNGALVTTPVTGYGLRSTVRLSLTTFSVELLFSTPTVSTVQDLFAFSSSTTGATVTARVALDSQILKIYNGNNLLATSSVAVIANRMNHVVLTYATSNAQARLYLNGALVATATGIGSNFSGTNYLVVAKNAAIAYDELYVYTATLTLAQVSAHLNSLQWCLNTCTGACTPTPSGNVCS